MIVHLAAQALTVRGHVRQRCAWCGVILIDEDLTRVMVPTEQAGDPFPTWPADQLVARDGGASWHMEPEWHDLEPGQTEEQRAWKIPDDACFALPPELTRAVTDPDA